VLMRFLDHSQFIIITHNKRTIGMADILYGVTMQEHGVSRIVSVKFHKADDQTGGEQRARAGTTLSERVEAPPPPPKSEEPEIMMAK
jgi:chromosome segregation protein